MRERTARDTRRCNLPQVPIRLITLLNQSPYIADEGTATTRYYRGIRYRSNYHVSTSLAFIRHRLIACRQPPWTRYLSRALCFAPKLRPSWNSKQALSAHSTADPFSANMSTFRDWHRSQRMSTFQNWHRPKTIMAALNREHTGTRNSGLPKTNQFWACLERGEMKWTD